MLFWRTNISRYQSIANYTEWVSLKTQFSSLIFRWHIFMGWVWWNFHCISMLTIPPSDFANLVSLPSADKSVTLLGIRCGSLKMLRLWSRISFLQFLVSWTEFTKLLWLLAMCLGSREPCSGKLSRQSLIDFIVLGQWHMRFGTG